MQDYPLLKALCWQGNAADPAELGEAEILALYERGWRWRGVLAELSAEEGEFIREIAQKHGSWLVNDV